MCGIVAIFNIRQQTAELRQKALQMSRKIRHRGPDWSGIYCGGSAILAHERLAIVDPESGRQPLMSPDGKVALAVNGEIYNHRDIRRRYAGRYAFMTGSDCEVILALWRDKGPALVDERSGIFAFALYDEQTDEFLIARDPIGVIPLYMGTDDDGTVYVASELKALEGFCKQYEAFPPGHYYYSRDGHAKQYYKRDWADYDAVKDNGADTEELRQALEQAVRRQPDEPGRRALCRQPATQQGGVYVQRDVREPLSQPLGRPHRAQLAERGVQHARGLGMGRCLRRAQRAQRQGRERGARPGLLTAEATRAAKLQTRSGGASSSGCAPAFVMPQAASGHLLTRTL